MTNNRPVFIATVLIVLLAISSAIFAIIQLNRVSKEEEKNNNPIITDNFEPDAQLSQEIQEAANRLIVNNYEVVQLYYVTGLPHLPEPYDNAPEDGIYTVDSDEYKTLADVEKLVDETFVKEQADEIKDNPDGDGPVFYDKDGVLGIRYDFSPNKNYKVNWSNPSFEIEAISETKCGLTVTLSKNNEDVEFTTQMIKEDGQWRLKKIIYQ